MPNPDKTPGQKLVEEWATERGISPLIRLNGDDLRNLAWRFDTLLAELVDTAEIAKYLNSPDRPIADRVREAIREERSFLQDIFLVAQMGDGCLPGEQMRQIRERLEGTPGPSHLLAELTPKRVLDLSGVAGWNKNGIDAMPQGVIAAIRAQLPDVEVKT